MRFERGAAIAQNVARSGADLLVAILIQWLVHDVEEARFTLQGGQQGQCFAARLARRGV